MPPLPAMHGREVVRQRGGHIVLVKSGSLATPLFRTTMKSQKAPCEV